MENIINQLTNTVQECEDGNISGLESLGKLRNLEKVLKSCIKQVEEVADNEWYRESEGKNTIDNFKGFEISKRSGGWSWNFKGVKEYSDIETKKKDLETKYKALFLHQNCIDAETGEVLDIERTPRKDSFVFKSAKS